MSWIKDIISPETRNWEEFYRNRFQHDRIVRSTHGVNCTGGCSWQIHVKDGIVVWETQQLDYPLLEDKLPPYEPRGCQRGISFLLVFVQPAAYQIPIDQKRVDRCLSRGKEARQATPMKAWEASAGRTRKNARVIRMPAARAVSAGRSWDEVLEIMAVGEYLYGQEIWPGSGHRFLADPGDVDAELRGRLRGSCSCSAASI